jgi:hypothetical protein
MDRRGRDVGRFVGTSTPPGLVVDVVWEDACGGDS